MKRKIYSQDKKSINGFQLTGLSFGTDVGILGQPLPSRLLLGRPGSGQPHATTSQAFNDVPGIEVKAAGEVDGVGEEVGVDEKGDGLRRTEGRARQVVDLVGELESGADQLELLLDVGDLQNLETRLPAGRSESMMGLAKDWLLGRVCRI